MYKLTLGSVKEIKPGSGASGTIETGRVVIVDGDGKYLQVDGNWGTELKNGLVRTYDATLDAAEIAMIEAKYTSASATHAAVYLFADMMVLQSTFGSVDAFIEHLVDTGVITIQDYTATDWKLDTVTVTTAGAGYEEDVEITIEGIEGDTPGVITCTVTIPEGETTGTITAAEITTAGKFKIGVPTQVIEVPGGTTAATLTVTMTEDE